MRQPLVSFIIPAYNAGSYIAACLESVLSLCRKTGECEVIVVNDGSDDNTHDVLQAFQDVYPGMVVIEQENRGLSMARNAGMGIAAGKYLCFVDADDELDADCDAACLVQTMEEGRVDIIGIDMRVMKGGRLAPYRRYAPIYNKVYSPSVTFMRGRNLMPCVYGYLYRREFLEHEGLRFMPGVYHEDEDFTVRAFAMGGTFMAVDVDFYIVMPRENSITTTRDKGRQRKKLRDAVRILAGLDAFAAGDTRRKECMECKLDYLAVDILRLLMRQGNDRDFEKEVIQSLRKIGRFPLRWRWELKYIAFRVYANARYHNL